MSVSGLFWPNKKLKKYGEQNLHSVLVALGGQGRLLARCQAICQASRQCLGIRSLDYRFAECQTTATEG